MSASSPRTLSSELSVVVRDEGAEVSRRCAAGPTVLCLMDEPRAPNKHRSYRRNIPVGAARFSRERGAVLGPHRNNRPAGTVVRGDTAGNHAFAQQVSPLPTYFVDQTAADSVIGTDDTRLVVVGQLVVDALGNGTITFVVPSLPPGPYSLMVYCPSCAQYSVPPGRVMAAVADFTIIPGSPNTATRPPESPLSPILRVVLGVAILIGSAFSARRIWLRSPDPLPAGGGV